MYFYSSYRTTHLPSPSNNNKMVNSTSPSPLILATSPSSPLHVSSSPLHLASSPSPLLLSYSRKR